MDVNECVRLEIGVLSVRPGDMLVIRADRDLPDAEVAGFMQALQGVIPRGVTAFLSGPGFEFQVVKADYEEVQRGLIQAARGLGPEPQARTRRGNKKK